MARRTFSDYKAAVVHALGAEPATGVDKGRVVNDALQHLVSMNSWRWRRGGPAALDLTADQSYVELPQDFGELYSIKYPGTTSRQVFVTTVEDIEFKRSTTTQPPGYTYFVAVNSGSLDEDERESGLTVNVLELWPTPTVSETGALSLVYLRQVDDLAEDTDVPQIPAWMDYAFELLVRDFAHTLEDDNPESAARGRFASMLPDLIKRDVSTQRRFGVMHGGLQTTGDLVSPFYPSNIADPG